MYVYVYIHRDMRIWGCFKIGKRANEWLPFKLSNKGRPDFGTDQDACVCVCLIV